CYRLSSIESVGLLCVPFLSFFVFFFSSRRRHTRSTRDWSSDVCSSDLGQGDVARHDQQRPRGPQAPARERDDVIPREPAQRFRRGTTAVRVAAVDLSGEESARDAAGLRQLELQRRQRPGAGEGALLGGGGAG